MITVEILVILDIVLLICLHSTRKIQALILTAITLAIVGFWLGVWALVDLVWEQNLHVLLICEIPWFRLSWSVAHLKVPRVLGALEWLLRDLLHIEEGGVCVWCRNLVLAEVQTAIILVWASL